MSVIRLLDPVLIDRIAAGEVVERPASAVKELVENAIDAGARSISVEIGDGGRRLIRVTDDGRGMDEADLVLAVERHATSKLPEGNLSDIRTLGFRGEALPSIAAVSRLTITTRRADAQSGLMLQVDAGARGEPRPASAMPGTRIEVADLFMATPARLKFLKSDRARGAGRGGGGATPRRGASADPLLAQRRASYRFHLAGRGGGSRRQWERSDAPPRAGAGARFPR
jgi:DNA mismatch repair protein MutL